MPETCCFQVSAQDVAVRLDRFLDDRLPELTRSQVKRLIDDGAVTLDGVASKAGVKLRGGESVCVVLPDPVAASAEPEPIPLSILYEDSSLIVINKPAHLVVHPAPGHHSGTLVNALLHHCHDLSGVGGELRPGIVHRLDKDTSGVMVATKDDRTHQVLGKQFKDHSIQRRYRALVYGALDRDSGSVDQPVGRHPVQRKKMSTSSRAGRRAVTHWQVRRLYPDDRMTLVDLSLETGRTHQIRVHMSSLNCPVVGDPLYGGTSRTKSIADSGLKQMVSKLGRQFLHAWQLGFEHPDGDEMLFQAPMPEELEQIILYLDKKYQYDSAELKIEVRAKACEKKIDENS